MREAKQAPLEIKNEKENVVEQPVKKKPRLNDLHSIRSLMPAPSRPIPEQLPTCILEPFPKKVAMKRSSADNPPSADAQPKKSVMKRPSADVDVLSDDIFLKRQNLQKT